MVTRGTVAHGGWQVDREINEGHTINVFVGKQVQNKWRILSTWASVVFILQYLTVVQDTINRGDKSRSCWNFFGVLNFYFTVRLMGLFGLHNIWFHKLLRGLVLEFQCNFLVESWRFFLGFLYEWFKSEASPKFVF